MCETHIHTKSLFRFCRAYNSLGVVCLFGCNFLMKPYTILDCFFTSYKIVSDMLESSENMEFFGEINFKLKIKMC